MKHPLVQELKLDVDLTKAQSVSYRLSDLLPVAPTEKQKLLEIDSAKERLSRLRKIIDKFHT
jgi:Lon protease-like protein